jgi:hypothetical protein
MWLVYAFDGEEWIWDLAGWVEHLTPTAAIDAKRPHAYPFYVLYLGYAFHSLVKDVRRCAGNFRSPMQAMFLFHHVLTLFLVALSVEWRCWRAGVLTRLCHGPADVGIYGGKVMIAAHGLGHVKNWIMATTYIMVTLTWWVLRVYMYGTVIYTLHLMYNLKSSEWETAQWWVCTSLLYGSWMMWILQVIWGFNLTGNTVRFLRYNDRGYDSIDTGQNVNKDIARAKGKGTTTDETSTDEPNDEDDKKKTR